MMKRKKGEKAFLDWLSKLKGQQGWRRNRAILKQSLAFGMGTYPPAMPLVEGFVKKKSRERKAYYLVAALYALKDGEHQEGRSLAQALGEKRNEGSENLEKRLLALLDSDHDQLPYRLRQLVKLVEGGIDFEQLLKDLVDWSDSKRDVQIRWAMEFYRAKGKGEEKVKA